MTKLKVLRFRGRGFRGLGFCSECVEPFAHTGAHTQSSRSLLENQTLVVTRPTQEVALQVREYVCGEPILQAKRRRG